MKTSLQGVLLVIGLIVCSIAWPDRVEMKGGRYYLYNDDIIITKPDGSSLWFTVDTTAKAGAVNESFKCRCPITIKQPDITVTTFSIAIAEPSDIELTWDMPTEREDGSDLDPADIDGYLIEWNGAGTEIHIPGNVLSYTLRDVSSGIHTFRIATVADKGAVGSYSESISVSVPK